MAYPARYAVFLEGHAMPGHTNHAGRSNMSLDGGYIGSIDHAIANLHVGRHQGRQQGIEEGLEEGYQQGFEEGRVSGWNEATAVANEKLREQLAYTHQHFAEKERIKAELVQQRELIDRLEAKVAELERENATLRGENAKLRKTDASLRELIDALKGANQRLQEQVTELDAKIQERTRQYADQLWQYNRTLIFMNSVRGVLEELTSDRSPNADHVRQLFAEKYAHQVSQGLKDGAIKAAPEVDDEFAKALPKTRKFIVDMLSSAESLKEVSQEPEEDWVP
ncbi:MAG: hypothetical protein WCY71_07840 [Halothiobacillaceae bacterium]